MSFAAEKTVEIPGARLRIAEAGQGDAILFVHGFPLNHRMWSHQLEALSPTWRCIAPDLRGFGMSSVTNGIVTMAQHADDMAALLDAMEVRTPVVYCGLSMGGYIGWEFARRHPGRLRALIQCDTRAIPDTPEGATGRRALASRVLQEGVQVVADAMLPRLFSQDTLVGNPSCVESVRQTMLASDPMGVAAALRGMAERDDATQWLETIAVPTLLLAGESDGISPPSEMSEIAAAMPNARLEVIPKAGHMAPLENFQRVNEILQAFLRKVA